MDNDVKMRIESLETSLKCEKKKYWISMIVFLVVTCILLILIIFVSLLFMDSSMLKNLQEGNVSVNRNIDYLQFVVPILLTTAGFFLAFLGMNRLKDIDTQVEKIRIELKEDFSGEKKQLVELRTELSENIQFEKKELQFHRNVLTESLDQKIDTKTSQFKENIRNELREEKENLEKELVECREKGISDIKDTFSEFIKDIKFFQERYDWLSSFRENDEIKSIMMIGSVADAHLQVEAIFSAKPDNVVGIIRHIVDRVVTQKISGDQSDYHNLAAELARNNLYDDACRVCEVGIACLGGDVDLLADWVNYATKIGKYDEALIAIHKLNDISYNLWNWRAFDFIIDYYLSVGDLKEANKLACDFVEWMPYEDRAYFTQANILRLLYGKKEGTIKEIEVLQHAVSLKINCPLCANRLAEIMCDIGQLKDALEYINLALKELAQEQPSINYAYVIYKRALIYDRLYYQYQCEFQSDDEHKWAYLAYRDYETAINSHKLSQITANHAYVRKELLSEFIPKEKREEVNNNVGIEQLIKLLTEEQVDPE